ncbi:MAG: helix-turn-helix domain-containing protein, partial [Actinobacteria bacterium]|nr:helix-turn-helix domain-containing protein [Actinomycetota bacterium]
MQAHGHSRKETAEIVGVAPETISVWKRHPQWQRE